MALGRIQPLNRGSTASLGPDKIEACNYARHEAEKAPDSLYNKLLSLYVLPSSTFRLVLNPCQA